MVLGSMERLEANDPLKHAQHSYIACNRYGMSNSLLAIKLYLSSNFLAYKLDMCKRKTTNFGKMDREFAKSNEYVIHFHVGSTLKIETHVTTET